MKGKIHVPKCLRFIEYNKKFFKKENENLYTYESIIPENGICEQIRATFYRIKGKFHKIYETELSCNQIKSACSSVPLYYKGGNNNIINYNIITNKCKEIDNYFNKENEKEHKIECKFGKVKMTYKKLFVQVFGEIEKNLDDEFKVINENYHLFKLKKKTKTDFKKHADKIIKESKYKNSPNYIKL